MSNIIRKLLNIVSVTIVIFSFFSFNNANAEKCGSTDPIIIPLHNWTSQLVMSHVVGQLFEKIDCRVFYEPSDVQGVFESIRVGDIIITVQIWERSFSKLYKQALSKGGIVDAGNHDAITREGWWLPDFVIKMCPGLPNWEFLKKCSNMFARPDSNGKGVYFDGPVEWLHDTRRIEALGMNFVTTNVKNVNDLWVEIENANKAKKAIVLFNWSPNFTDSLYGGQFVEFPEFDKKCETDKTWGINPNMTHDCGDLPGGYLKKAAWKGMSKKWPDAYELLKNINFTTKNIGDMAAYVDVDQMPYAVAARSWIIDNKETWKPWLLNLE